MKQFTGLTLLGGAVMGEGDSALSALEGALARGPVRGALLSSRHDQANQFETIGLYQGLGLRSVETSPQRESDNLENSRSATGGSLSVGWVRGRHRRPRLSRRSRAGIGMRMTAPFIGASLRWLGAFPLPPELSAAGLPPPFSFSACWNMMRSQLRS